MDQFTLLRYLCSLDINIEEIKLGGDGKIVEIDESMFAKVKHFKGKDLQRRQLWVFGMKEREKFLALLLTSQLFYLIGLI